MAKLRLLKTGHGDLTLAEWDRSRPDTVATAKSLFEEHCTPGRLAFRLDGPGQSRPIRDFDPTAAEILIVPPIQGGSPRPRTGLAGAGPLWTNRNEAGPDDAIMIRTGYLRWEIEVVDSRSQQDHLAREVAFLARPTHRVVRVKSKGHADAAERFARGEAAYDDVLRTANREGAEVELTIPDVGPHTYRYAEADRATMIRYWMEKLQREASAFAHEVVRVAASFPQLVIASPALRAGYARLVEAETFRVIEGKSTPQPTSLTPLAIDENIYQQGVPELVAAELVRDVVEPKEFHEFCQFDMITVKTGDKYYRIPRRPHSLIEVWDAVTRKPLTRLCVVFQDPGMPPSDEVVMKYLLAKHQPEMLWQLGVRFSPPAGKFEVTPPRRWTVD